MLLDGTPAGLAPYVASIKSLFFTTCCFNAASCPSGRLLLINLKKIKDMTRQEFIDRTGFTPTEDHFKAIHEEYMAAGDGVDKDTFCERWLKNNGVQLGYDWMHSRLEGTEGELAAAKETNRELGNRIADLGDIIDSKDVEIGRLKDRIRLLEAQKTAHEVKEERTKERYAHEVKEERMKERYADRTDEFFRYRKALTNLHEEADSEDLKMALDEIEAALAAGTGSKA